MGLIKKIVTDEPTQPIECADQSSAAHIPTLDPIALRTHYLSLDQTGRRQILKALAATPEALEFFLNQALEEDQPLLLQLIFDSLMSLAQIDGQERSVVSAMLRLMREGDASRRGLAVRFLSAFPHVTAEIVPTLLRDPDVDIRLYALDVIQHLVHPDVPNWIVSVLESEEHPNVIASAIDRGLEAGCTELQPLFRSVSERFSHVPFVQFVVKLAHRRLGGLSQ